MELLSKIPDGFMGKGSTALAANSTERKYLDAEISQRYYEITQSRIKEGR